MGKYVNGFRSSFYRDLLREYKHEGEKSFLYQFFWTESIKELLEVCSLTCSVPVKPANIAQIRAQLEGAVKQHPALIPTKAGDESQKKRVDFWAELFLNDAGYRTGLISDMDYYLWLVDVLAAHNTYYKDTSLWDIHSLLIPLLQACLGVRESELKKRKTGSYEDEYVFSTVQFEKHLKELAAEVRNDRAKIINRLHGLEKGYLPQLTGQLERMALHIKIKNWFQYSGYPLVKDERKERVKRSTKRPQKRDFSMQLLGAYFDSGRGDRFREAEQESGKGWRMDGNSFCVMGQDEIEALQRALEQSGQTNFYIPLGVDLRSGCVFFAAGKDFYQAVYDEAVERLEQDYSAAEKAYQEEKQNYIYARNRYSFKDKQAIKDRRDRAEKEYRTAKKALETAQRAREHYNELLVASNGCNFCFDYLRLDRVRSPLSGLAAGGFCLQPKFHRNAGKDYQEILEDFKYYCESGDLRFPEEGIPRQEIRSFNADEPAGIPKIFHWAFDGPDGQEESDLDAHSSEAAKDFFRRRSQM